jgi:hypothetical protein
MTQHEDPVYLDHPSVELLEETFRQLPRHGRLLVSCHPADLAETLRAMEDAGLVAMQCNRSSRRGSVIEISAFKAKQGPCYDTGKEASYLGTAVAALDDDNHLVFRQLRVCEKTAEVYQLPPYHGLVKLSDGDPRLVNRLADDPVLFDCNTYEQDLEHLLSMVSDSRPETDSRSMTVFYPGPFRLLVLSDGSMVRRGQATTVAHEHVVQLCERDRCVEIDGITGVMPVAAANLLQVYQELGSACLLGELPLVDTHRGPGEADFSALERVSETTRKRLISIIKNQDRLFVLTGTDPDAEHGCCPSDEVGDALSLVNAAILACYRSPAPPDSCPTTVFAFAGEISAGEGSPGFTTNHVLRQQVLDYLTRRASDHRAC